MVEFAAALVTFLALHSLPAATGLRTRLMDRFGRRAYLTAYSLVSVAALVWLIAAAQDAPTVAVWQASPITAMVPLIAMAPACVLFAAGIARPNPLSVSFRGGPTPPATPGILALTRHPILWAFFLWASAHAVANGDVVGLILFGGFAAFSLVGMPLMIKRARRRLSHEEFAAALAVAEGPLARRLKRAVSPGTALECLLGAVLYLGALAAHETVIGIDPFAVF